METKFSFALFTRKSVQATCIFFFIFVLLVFTFPETVNAQEPKWDIYLCIDVSRSVLPAHKEKMKQTLNWIFKNKLRGGEDGDRLAILLFGGNCKVFRELNFMRKEEEEVEPKITILKNLTDEIGLNEDKEIYFDDPEIDTQKTQFQSVAGLLKSIITDKRGTKETTTNRLPVVVLLTDGEQDIDDGVSTPAEIRSVDRFTKVFYISTQGEGEKKYTVKFVFFIVSHSKWEDSKSIEKEWYKAFGSHKSNLKYCDRTEYRKQAGEIDEDKWAGKIDEVFQCLRFLRPITFSAKPLSCITRTSIVNPIELWYCSDPSHDKKNIKVELVPTESSQGTPLGIRFQGYGMERFINIHGNGRKILELLPVQIFGDVPEYPTNQKLTLRFSGLFHKSISNYKVKILPHEVIPDEVLSR